MKKSKGKNTLDWNENMVEKGGSGRGKNKGLKYDYDYIKVLFLEIVYSNTDQRIKERSKTKHCPFYPQIYLQWIKYWASLQSLH